ncbi:lysozyme inhibitor LprI family protein [Cupriavidus pinatubonensis]|uniref:Lysozyme inhibitor LprI-like N-terminal domain-containing protein n=1 Tax=Cupriavidus pinatubonensis TaxID=248026 RepID=A0ABN7ZE22_9BURK|nr:lysozyme inhibitor LprI family protein [Cupriavidus pinatubonensis]CAG9183225.1 hypothetical protein LMG23994_05089 [Cupriavidus pinatubonensis]
MVPVISLAGVVGAVLVCALCRQPSVKFFSPVTVFNRKQKLTPIGAKLYVLFLVVILAGFGLQAFLRVSSTGDGGLPSCSGEGTQKLLKDAFDQSQLARSENLSLVEASQITDLSSADKTKRLCRAQISLNNAENVFVRYQLEPRDGGKVLLTFGVEEEPQQAASEDAKEAEPAQEAAVVSPSAAAQQPQQAVEAVQQQSRQPTQVVQQDQQPLSQAPATTAQAEASTPVIEASFDCQKASSKIEKLICSSPDTAAADKRLGSVYRTTAAKSGDPAGLKQQQRDWLKERNACDDAACLLKTTEARIQALSAM